MARRFLFRELRARMMLNGDTQADLSRALLLGKTMISHKLTAKRPWTLEEMYVLLDRYQIPYDQMHIYFPKDGKSV